jgi:hypothetical protein
MAPPVTVRGGAERSGLPARDPAIAPGETVRIQRLLAGFERRFGAPHLAFACHVAVPVALTPELAYQIWTNFRVDTAERPLEIPWIAVADLLLSELCAEISPELYEIQPDVRRALVERLRADERLGERRLGEIASFLLAAAESGWSAHDTYSASLATSQRWAALAYTAPERAAAMIAEAMRDLSAADPAAWSRMDALLQALSDPLAGHAPLRSMAAAMASFARGKNAPLEEHLRAFGQTISAAGQAVTVPVEAMAALRGRPPTAGVGPGTGPIEPEAPSQPRVRPPESRVERLNVLFAGVDGPVPDTARGLVEALAAALAHAGYRLITNGRAGLDEVVSRAFSDAVPPDADYEQRLMHITAGGKAPVFKGGGWVQVPGSAGDRSAEVQAVAMANVVVGMGGPLADLEALAIADQFGKFVVPLLWMGGRLDAYPPEPPEEGYETPLCRTGRVFRMLRSEAVASLPPGRWLMSVIELSDPDKARAFREYNDALADCIFTSYRDLDRDGTPPLLAYYYDLREAGTGAPRAQSATMGSQTAPSPGALSFDDAVRRLKESAAAVPCWLLHDLAQIGEPEDWTKRHEVREALLRSAARHARPHIADVASALFRGPSPGPIEPVRELLQAVREELRDPRVHQEWLRPVIVAWAPVLLAGTAETSDRGHSMVALLREITAPPKRVFLRPLLESHDRHERVAGYLLSCAFPPVLGLADAFDSALEREIADADWWGTGWALLWLARALWSLTNVYEEAVTEANREPRVRTEATLLRLHRFWTENPERDPRREVGTLQGLITGAHLPGLSSTTR